MTTFHVHFTRYVEQRVALPVEAATLGEAQARAAALIQLIVDQLLWQPGESVLPPQITKVTDDAGDVIWEV